MTTRIEFLGLNFEPLTTDRLVQHLARDLKPIENFSYLVTPNVDHRVRLEREPSLRPLYDNADLTVNDSRVLAFLASKSGLSLPASPGADVVEELFRKHIAPGESVNLIGGSFAVMHALRTRFGLRKINWHQPPMGLKSNPEAIAECAKFMAEHPARFQFLAVGSPQQEMIAWAAKLRGDVKGWGLCCGASLDFLAGVTERAPLWMQSAGLEWLHRLLSNPRRLAKRYLLDGPQIFLIWRRWLKDRKPVNHGNGSVSPSPGQ